MLISHAPNQLNPSSHESNGNLEETVGDVEEPVGDAIPMEHVSLAG